MKVGDIVIVEGHAELAMIIDDCFRETANGCTMLVRLNDTDPVIELEVNKEDVREYGQDI